MQDNKEDPTPNEQLKNTVQPIELDETGALVLRNNEDMRRVTNLWFESQMLPTAFQATPAWKTKERNPITEKVARQRIFTAVQMLQGLGFDFKQTLPLLKYVAFVNDSLCIFGDLPLIVVERSGLMVDKEEFVFDQYGERICARNKNLKADVFGAKVKVKPRGRTWKEAEYTIDDAKAARLIPQDERFSDPMEQARYEKSAWCKHTKRMLIMRARGYCLRDNFALAFANGKQADILESDVDNIPADYETTQVIDTEHVADDATDLSDIY